MAERAAIALQDIDLDADLYRDAPQGNGKPALHSPASRTLIVVRAADITPEKIEWLWAGRIARGKHTTIAGDPGTGKSQIAVAVAATVTTGGCWPCDEGRSPVAN